MTARRDGGHGRRARRRRLARSADFDRVFRDGRSHASRYLVLHAFPRVGSSTPAAAGGESGPSATEAGGSSATTGPPAATAAGTGDRHASTGADARPRLGVSVGRRVGGAVERNRVKRLLREAFWMLAPSLPADHDFVLVARPDAGDLARREGEAGFESALRELAERAGLVPGPPAGDRTEAPT